MEQRVEGEFVFSCEEHDDPKMLAKYHEIPLRALQGYLMGEETNHSQRLKAAGSIARSFQTAIEETNEGGLATLNKGRVACGRCRL